MRGGQKSLEVRWVCRPPWSQDEDQELPHRSSCSIRVLFTVSGPTLPSLHTAVPVLLCATSHTPNATCTHTPAVHTLTCCPHTHLLYLSSYLQM